MHCLLKKTNMKKILVFLTLSLVGLAKAQSFEGTLSYECTFIVSEKMSNLGITLESLKKQSISMGGWVDTIKTTYKKGNYLTVLNNKIHSRILYRADSNKIYSWNQPMDSSICTVIDAGFEKDERINGQEPLITLLDTNIKIYGHSCKLVRIKWKTDTYEYYFSDSLYPMLASYYNKHICEGWYAFLSHSNALPIMLVKKSKSSVTAIITLFESKEEKVNDNVFIVPELVPSNVNSFIPYQKVMRLKNP